MKHIRALPRVMTSAAALAGLAVASLATSVVTNAPASAEESSVVTTYDCSFTLSLLGVPVSATLPVPVTVSVPEGPMWDGTPVAAGSVPLSVELDLDALTDVEGLPVANAIVQLLGFDGQLGGTLQLDSSHPLMIGSVPVTSSLSAEPAELDDVLTDGVLEGDGSLDSFTPRGVGMESVFLPTTFDFLPNGTSGPSVGSVLPVGFAPVTCTSETGAPAVAARVRVAAAGTSWADGSRLSVVGPKHARRGATVAFRATLPGGAGRVIARVGRRTVGQGLLVGGAAKVKVRGLRKGANRITFTAGTARAGATVQVR